MKPRTPTLFRASRPAAGAPRGALLALVAAIGLAGACAKSSPPGSESATPEAESAAPAAPDERGSAPAGATGALATEGGAPAAEPTPGAPAAPTGDEPVAKPTAEDTATPSGPLWPTLPESVTSRIEEEIEAGAYKAKVTSPWGTVEVTGAAEGIEGVISRYWAGFSTAEFDAVYAFATGEMRERLGTYDSEQGRKDFRSSIESRMVGNPMVAVRVESGAETGPDRAGGLAITRRADGKEEEREMTLVREAAGWRVERVQMRR